MKADIEKPSSDDSKLSRTLQDWQQSIALELQRLADRDQLRDVRAHSGRVDFSSNDYLSLNASGRMRRWLRETLGDDSRPTAESTGTNPTESVGSTGSRLIRGHYPVFEEVEAAFARYVGTEAALLCHSGYAANTGALPAVIGPRDLVFADRLCHASLLDGIRLSGARRYYFQHNDLADLEQQLRKYTGASNENANDSSAPTNRRCWIVTETVFSMDGDSPDLRALCDLADRFGALVYLDEAHAIGLVGPGGAGLAMKAGVSDRIAVNVFPCGKAPGLMGAFVCGSVALKRLLINTARPFIFTTAQPPHLVRLLGRVVEWLQTSEADEARSRVRNLADRLRTKLKELDYNTGTSMSHIVPVIVGESARALELAERCQQSGLDVRAIRPPTVPKGTSRLRVILQSGHKEGDVDELLAVLARAKQENV